MQVNPKLSYVLAKVDKEYLILAEKRVGEFIARHQMSSSRPAKDIFKTLLMFQGDTLDKMRVEHPLLSVNGPQEVPVVQNEALKPTFGTGIHTVSPAHSIDALRLSYQFGLSREGCVDPATGKLTQPFSLTDFQTNDPSLTPELIKRLKEKKAFFASFKYQGPSYTAKSDGEIVNLITVDGFFVNLSEKLKYKCF